MYKQLYSFFDEYFQNYSVVFEKALIRSTACCLKFKMVQVFRLVIQGHF